MPTCSLVMVLVFGAIGAAACSSTEAPTSTQIPGSGGAAGTSAGVTSSGGAGTSSGGSGGIVSAGSADVGGAGGGAATPDASTDASSAPDAIARELAVSPTELIFSAVQNVRSAPKAVSLKNPSMAALQLGSVALDPAAMGTASFELMSGPKAGSTLLAGDMVTVDVVFHPTGIGVFQSNLIIKTSDPVGQKTVGLFGLGAKGLEGENEPPLKLVVETLGFAIDVGGATLSLGTSAALIGDEVAAFRFKASGAMPVELIPVARYSPQELLPYGYYTASGEVVIGTILADQNQTLYPATQAGSKSTFDPPAGEFGIFTTSATHKTYSEDTKNTGNQTIHAVRTYPLKNRTGMPIANSYLLCMEEAANGDYQDYVFQLSNVVPVAR
jgi:hypothetical protein